MNIVQALFGDLTKPGVTDNGQTTYYDNPALAAIGLARASAKNAQPIPTEYSGDLDSPITEDTDASPSPEPTIGTPSFLRASQGPEGTTAKSPALTKKGALMAVLLGGLHGGMRSAGTKTFGQGFENAEQAPIQLAGAKLGLERERLGNELAKAQILNLPWQRAAMTAGLEKTQAETGKIGAEAQGQQYENALREAQANAAKYKEVNGQLFDISGTSPTPIQGVGQMVPADEDMAGIAHVPIGTPLPLQTAHTLKGMATQGITSVSANGRQLLVDKSGKTIKDLGTATPVVVMNNQLGAAGNSQSQEFQAVVDAVGNGKMDLQTALGKMGRFPGAAFSLMAEVEKKYPGYFQGNYEAAKKLLDSATSGKIGDEITAFNTAIDHAKMLKEAALALKNGNVQLFNKWANAWATATGNPVPTNYQTIADAFRGESTAVYNKGHITEGLLKEQGEKLGNGQSEDQLIQGLDTAIKLMEKKMGERKKQFDKGMQGKTAFPDNASPQTHVFSVSAWKAANPKGDAKAAEAAAKAQNYQVVP
jgi:hypothetical protein